MKARVPDGTVSLVLSFLGLAIVIQRVRRRQTEAFDRQWADRAGRGHELADHFARLAQPMNGLYETIVLALLPLSPRSRAIVIGAPLLAGSLGHALKLAVPRDRPGRARFSPEGNQSFPSTHTAHASALSFAVAGVAREHGLGKWVPVAAAAVVATMGLARLRAGVHWPTDVLAGGLVGLAGAQAARLVAEVAFT
jgi:membrane-associated phospholipid phosphatase